MGRFDRERWRKDWQGLFDTHDLIHNRRTTVKIEVSKEHEVLPDGRPQLPSEGNLISVTWAALETSGWRCTT